MTDAIRIRHPRAARGRLRRRPTTLVAIALLCVVAFAGSGCIVEESAAARAKPTIEDCSNWSGDRKRCPKACFSPTVAAGTIKTYTPTRGEKTIRAGATAENQERLEEQFANELGPRKVKLPLPPPRKPDEEDEANALDLLVRLTPAGFELATDHRALPPADGCPDDGPTICLLDTGFDVATRTKQAASLARKGEDARAEVAVDLIVDQYDWRRLYNELMTIKREYPNTSFFRLEMTPDLPYALVIRAMDVARVQLERARYGELAEFEAAPSKTLSSDGDTKRYALFPRPIISLTH